MTRAQARTRVRYHINEVDTTSKWSDAELNDYLKQANDDLYYRLAQDAPEHFRSVAAWTWDANTESQDISAAGKLGAEFARIVKVRYSATSGTFGPSNVPIPMSDVGFDELPSLYSAGGLTGSIPSYSWATSGPFLYIAPFATTPLYLQVYWIPRPTALDSGATPDSNNLLDGKLLQVHGLICIKAAQLALAKTREKNTSLDAEEAKAEKRYDDEFTSDRTSGPSFVHDPYGATWRE